MASPLFDEDWYSRVAEVSGSRLDLVRHYLRTPVAKRASPNPLFDRAWFRAHHAPDLGDRDPFLVYLRRKPFRTPTHPLFDTRRYLRRTPGASTHPHGPIGHYAEVGAAAGVPANKWLVGRDGEPTPSLLAWIAARRAEWVERAAPQRRQKITREDLRRGEHLVSGYAHIRPDVPSNRPLVSLVLVAGSDVGHLATSLRSLRAQRLTSWQVVVVDRGRIPQLADVLDAELEPGTWQLVAAPGEPPAGGINRAVEQSTGDWLAFLGAGDTWDEDRLRLLTAVGQVDGDRAIADVLRRVRRDGSSSSWVTACRAAPSPTEHRRPGQAAGAAGAFTELGGLDEDLPGAWTFGLVARLAEREGVRAIPFQGVTRHAAWALEARRRPAGYRPALDHTRSRRGPTWCSTARWSTGTG